MLDYRFINREEELLHIIRTRGSSYEDYRKLIEKVQNIDYTDGNDRSFLHVAITEGKTEIARDLLDRGIDVNLQNINGYTAARIAADSEQWDILEEILKHHPKVNLKDWRYGDCLLYDVVRYKSEKRNEIAKKLIAMGADPYSENNSGGSPLSLAMLQKDQELIELFQQAKPVCEEEDVFRVPKKGKGVFKIQFKDYDKYICVKDTSLSYLEEKITDYARICGGKTRKLKFRVMGMENSRWSLIACPEKIDFYNYHNLVSWIFGLPSDEKLPGKTVCVAVNRNDARLSYYGIMDKEKFGDHIVGRFQNGESFRIYLPEANKKGGNASSYSDVLPVKMIGQYLGEDGFDEAWLDGELDVPCREVEVDMAV